MSAELAHPFYMKFESFTTPQARVRAWLDHVMSKIIANARTGQNHFAKKPSPRCHMTSLPPEQNYTDRTDNIMDECSKIRSQYPTSRSLSLKDIRKTAFATMAALRSYRIKCCLFGSAACSMYGMRRAPNVRRPLIDAICSD